MDKQIEFKKLGLDTSQLDEEMQILENNDFNNDI